MRTIELAVSFPPSNKGSETITFEVEDDATEEQIAEMAEAEFFNVCNFGWEEK